MSMKDRSPSPQTPPRDEDVDMDNGVPDKPTAKVVVVTNLTRNVVEAHLHTIFGFYGKILKIDIPVYAKSGQNRGKAAVEYFDPESAHKAATHMDGGQLDGAVLKVELSDLPVRSRSRSPRPRPRNGRGGRRSISRSPSRSRSPRFARRDSGRFGDSYRRPYGRRQPVRDTYRPHSPSRSRSPVRRGGLGPRRRSPSYERGGYGRRGRSRSPSYSVRSSRSRSRSLSRSRSRSRSASYSSYSRYSRSRSRSRSYSRGRRSNSRDDIRDSRSRSPPPAAAAAA
ncbi:RNA-binding domain-containing protein [Dentipellis sp. KUC8613]|nr:RNA-binding domain-containing protein [Dentipellis sp. KUC8613]